MIQALLEYQTVDAKLKAIETRLSASEDRKKAMVAKKFLESVNESVEKLDAKAAELTQSYKDLALRQNELLESVSEYDTVAETCGEDEVEYVHKKAKELEDRIVSMAKELNTLEETIENIVAQYNTLQKKTVEAQKQYRECGAKYNELKASVQEEREEITKKLAAMEKTVDPALMAKYQAKRNDKVSFPIVLECTENRCPACGMEFSLQEVNKLKTNKIDECENCRKLIFVK